MDELSPYQIPTEISFNKGSDDLCERIDYWTTAVEELVVTGACLPMPCTSLKDGPATIGAAAPIGDARKGNRSRASGLCGGS